MTDPGPTPITPTGGGVERGGTSGETERETRKREEKEWRRAHVNTITKAQERLNFLKSQIDVSTSLSPEEKAEAYQKLEEKEKELAKKQETDRPPKDAVSLIKKIAGLIFGERNRVAELERFLTREQREKAWESQNATNNAQVQERLTVLRNQLQYSRSTEITLSKEERKELTKEISGQQEKLKTERATEAPPKEAVELVERASYELFGEEVGLEKLEEKASEKPDRLRERIGEAREKASLSERVKEAKAKAEALIPQAALALRTTELTPRQLEKEMKKLGETPEKVAQLLREGKDKSAERILRRLAKQALEGNKREEQKRLEKARQWWLTKEEKDKIGEEVLITRKGKNWEKAWRAAKGLGSPLELLEKDDPLGDIAAEVIHLDELGYELISSDYAEDLYKRVQVVLRGRKISPAAREQLNKVFLPAMEKLRLLSIEKKADLTRRDEELRVALDDRLRPGVQSFRDQLVNPFLAGQLEQASQRLQEAMSQFKPRSEQQAAYDEMIRLVNRVQEEKSLLQIGLYGDVLPIDKAYDALVQANLRRGVTPEQMAAFRKSFETGRDDFARDAIKEMYGRRYESSRLNLMLSEIDIKTLRNPETVEEWFEQMLDEARQPSPESSTYFQILTLAYTEVASMYRNQTGMFETGKNQELFDRLTKMFRAKLNFISAFKVGGIQQHVEDRLKALPYFTSKEMAWFGQQWWCKLAWAELSEHPDEVLKYLALGERPDRVEKFKEDTRGRVNKWLETIINNANSNRDVELRNTDRQILVRLFGEKLFDKRRGVYDFDREKIKEIIGRPNLKDGEWVTSGDIEWSYDFLRWTGRFAVLDARFSGFSRAEEQEKDRDGRIKAKWSDEYNDNPLQYEWYGRNAPEQFREAISAFYENGDIEHGEFLLNIERDPDYHQRITSVKAKRKVSREQAIELERKFSILRKVMEFSRRGEWDAQIRGIMNVDFNYWRKGFTYGSSLRERWDRILTEARDFMSFEFGESLKHKDYWDAENHYLRPMSFEYEAVGGVDGALTNREAHKDQLEALESISLLGDKLAAEKKATHPVDWHNELLGVQAASGLLGEILLEPMESVEEETVNKLKRLNFISESFQLPAVLPGSPPEKNLFFRIGHGLLEGIGLIEEQEDFWANRNDQLSIETVKTVMAGHIVPIDSQVFLLRKLARDFFVDVPPEFSLKPKDLRDRIRAKITNAWNFEAYCWYVLGPWKMAQYRFFGFFGGIADAVKGFFKTIYEYSTGEKWPVQ